jgi:hypothetical protein
MSFLKIKKKQLGEELGPVIKSIKLNLRPRARHIWIFVFAILRVTNNRDQDVNSEINKYRKISKSSVEYFKRNTYLVTDSKGQWIRRVVPSIGRFHK